MVPVAAKPVLKHGHKKKKYKRSDSPYGMTASPSMATPTFD